MKFLVVFVSALVLVAHGKVLTAEEGERAYNVQYQEPSQVQVVFAPDVDSSEEAQTAEAQNAYAVDAGVPVGMRLFGAEEPRAASSQGQETGVSNERVESIYIPILTRTCTNSVCAYICSLLGFANGICASVNTCQCSN